MRAQEQPRKTDGPGRPQRPAATATPGTGPLRGLATSPGTVLALQRAAGNAAVARTVEEARHEHSADCGHARPVQRAAVPEVLRSPGRPLDGPVRAEMEARLGADFGDVRLHTDATAQRSAAELGARAYTSGSHVVIGGGGADKHTLAHELTHVIQQRSGPVAGTDNGAGLRVSDPSDRFERAAEANAARVMSGPVPAPGPVRGNEGAGGSPGAPSAGSAVQRLVGFEAELSVPSFGAGNTAGFEAVEGRQPSPVIGSFLRGGLDYATNILHGGKFSVITDHNVLGRKGRKIHEVLSGMTAGGKPVISGGAPVTLSNLEYATSPFDEMAPGSDNGVRQVAEEIDRHVGAIFQNRPKEAVSAIPGASQFGTGTPVNELRDWLGQPLFATPELQAALADFQQDVTWAMHIQATVGVAPTGLPSLYEAQEKVSHESRKKPGNEHTADAWTHAAHTVARQLETLRGRVVPELERSLGRTLETGDKEALTGTLALGLSYAVGNAMFQGGVSGRNSTAKNAVPLLLKMGDLGAVRRTATTDVLRSVRLDNAVVKDLANWIHGNVPETNIKFWQDFIGRYGSDRANPRGPIYGDGGSPVDDTYGMLSKLLNDEGDFAAVAPGKSLERPDEPAPQVAPHMGGQKGAPVEFRWITLRATGQGQLWPIFKEVLDEARKANLRTVPPDVAQQIVAAATDPRATPAHAAHGALGAHSMETD